MANNNQTPITVPKLEARVARLGRPGSNVLATVNLTIADSFAVRGFTIMTGKKGPFVQVPQRSFQKDGKTEYVENAFPVTKEAREAMTQCIMGAYEAYVRDLQAPVKNAAAPGGAHANEPEQDSWEQPPYGGQEPDYPY